jgi:hypothetical protein
MIKYGIDPYAEQHLDETYFSPRCLSTGESVGVYSGSGY